MANNSYRQKLQGVWNSDVSLLGKFSSQLPTNFLYLNDSDSTEIEKSLQVAKEFETRIDNPSEYIECMAPVILETYSIPIFGTSFQSPSYTTIQDGYFERKERERRSDLVRDHPARISYIKNDDLSIHYPLTSEVLVRIPFEGAQWKHTESDLLDIIFSNQIQAGFLQTRGYYGKHFLDEELSIPQEDMVHSLLRAVSIEAMEKLSIVDSTQRSLHYCPQDGQMYEDECLPNMQRILAEKIFKQWQGQKQIHALRYAIKENWNKSLHAFSHCGGFEIGKYVEPTFIGDAKVISERKNKFEQARQSK